VSHEVVQVMMQYADTSTSATTAEVELARTVPEIE